MERDKFSVILGSGKEIVGALGVLQLSDATSTVQRPAPFCIDVLDSATLRGVPLARLATNGCLSYYSDNGGSQSPLESLDCSVLQCSFTYKATAMSTHTICQSDGYVNARIMLLEPHPACGEAMD